MEQPDIIAIINRISELRTRAGFTARALSIAIGMNENYVNGLEARKNWLPSMEVMFNIISALGVTATEFFGDPDVPAFYADKGTVQFLNENKDIVRLWKTASPEKRAAALAVLRLK
jgi:transcriptional regulator with XRE-family HTH domain